MGNVQYIYEYMGKNGFPYYITHVNGVAYFVRNAVKVIRDGRAIACGNKKWRIVCSVNRLSEDRVELI